MTAELTSEDIAKDLLNPFKDALIKGGFDDKRLLKQLNKEFENEEVKIIKVRGQVDSRTLPKNYKIIARPRKFEDGETIIEYRVHNIGISQRARMDVQKLEGLYPAEKHEVRGGINLIPEPLTPEQFEFYKGIAEQLKNAIISEYKRSDRS